MSLWCLCQISAPFRDWILRSQSGEPSRLNIPSYNSLSPEKSSDEIFTKLDYSLAGSASTPLPPPPPLLSRDDLYRWSLARRSHLANVRLPRLFVLQLEAVVRDALDICGGARLRLYAEHGCDRRTQEILIDIGGILRACRKAHRHAHQHGQHATDRAVPQVTGLQITSRKTYLIRQCICYTISNKSFFSQ